MAQTTKTAGKEGGFSLGTFLSTHGLEKDFKLFALTREEYFASQPRGIRSVSLWWATLSCAPHVAQDLSPDTLHRLLEAFLAWREQALVGLVDRPPGPVLRFSGGFSHPKN